MKINAIEFKSFNYNKGNERNNTYSYTKPIGFDSVSFSGVKKEEKELTPKETGIKIGEAMIQLAKQNRLNKKNISELMNKHAPKEIDVLDINEHNNLPQSMGKIVAYMQPYYDENFEFLSAELYLGDFENIKNPEKQSDFIANSAHEYTHFIQRDRNKDMNGVLKYFNDMDKFQIISGVGFKVLEELLYYQATQITSNEEKNEKAKEEIKNGNFDFANYAVNINAPMQILQIGYSIANQKNYDIAKTQKALLEWIYNTARDEEEAYEVTLATYDKCEKVDEDTKTTRFITKEAYKYIANELEPIVKQLQ